MVRTYRVAALAATMVLAVLGLPGVAAAQAAQPATLESFAGAWEGSAQTPNGEVSLRAAFKVQEGKLTGTIESSMGLIAVVSSALSGDTLTMVIDFQGSSGALGCKLQGNRIDGVWEVGGDSGPFWLARPGTGNSASVGDPVSGTWTGEVDIAGQLMPFSMDLRLSGEAVTGEMISAAGKVPLASGSWKDGALQLGFPYMGGEPVVMGATLKDGKLVGLIDYNRGEASGTWTAARK
ncbi:MAG: hypothetical protein R6V57_06065 [Vicinamibacterales bacterium]